MAAMQGFLGPLSFHFVIIFFICGEFLSFIIIIDHSIIIIGINNNCIIINVLILTNIIKSCIARNLIK